VAIVWAYRGRRQQLKSQQSKSTAIHGNAAAKAKAERIERRLLLFAIFTFFGHVLMSIMLVCFYNCLCLLLPKIQQILFFGKINSAKIS
jgi:hypothetical protein